MFNSKNLFIALTYVCNAYCTKCMTRHHKNKGMEINRELLNRFFYLLSKNDYSNLVSVGTGEPLLYSDFDYFVENVLAVNSKIRLRLLTNGMLLTPDKPKLFNDRCIWGVTMDAFNQDSLQGLQKGVDIERVKYNVATVAKIYGGSNMYLNFTVYRTNIDEIMPFVKFAVENNIHEIYLTELKVFTGYEKDLEGYTVIRDEHLEEVLNSTKKFLLEKGISTRGVSLERGSPRTECYKKNIASPIIDVDGSVSFCSGREDIYVGNILDNDIETKWQEFMFRVSCTGGKWCEKCYDRIGDDGTYLLPKTIRKEKGYDKTVV